MSMKQGSRDMVVGLLTHLSMGLCLATSDGAGCTNGGFFWGGGGIYFCRQVFMIS